MDNNLINFLSKEFNKTKTQNNNLVENTQLLDFNYYLPNDILVKVDRASMENSLEADHRFLIETI